MKLKGKLLKCFFDGSCKPNPGLMRIGGIIKSSTGTVYKYSIPKKDGTSNQAEYHSLIKILRVIKKLKKKHNFWVAIYGDSELVIKQANGKYDCRSSKLQHLHKKTIKLMSDLNISKLNHCSRDDNWEADNLTKIKTKININYLDK